MYLELMLCKNFTCLFTLKICHQKTGSCIQEEVETSAYDAMAGNIGQATFLLSVFGLSPSFNICL